MLLRSSTKTSPKGTYSICCTTSPLRLVSNYCYPNGLGGSRTASSRMRRPLGSYSLQLSTKLVPAQLPSCRHCSRSPYHRHSRCCHRHCTVLQRLPPFFYFIRHISIFIFEITNCDLKRIVVILRTKVVLLAFKPLLHNPFL